MQRKSLLLPFLILFLLRDDSQNTHNAVEIEFADKSAGRNQRFMDTWNFVMGALSSTGMMPYVDAGHFVKISEVRRYVPLSAPLSFARGRRLCRSFFFRRIALFFLSPFSFSFSISLSLPLWHEYIHLFIYLDVDAGAAFFFLLLLL